MQEKQIPFLGPGLLVVNPCSDKYGQAAWNTGISQEVTHCLALGSVHCVFPLAR